jgi:tRNA A-37 threonylcarbamoyl transferase component Bud32
MATMQSVGKYQLIRELGKGATGKVYLADDPFAKRKVAVKVAFPQALKADEDSAMYKSMFLNEAALAGKLNHPHIVQIFDAVVEDKYSYIVMEYVEGGTLEKFCKPDALLETREVAEIIFKCVRALAFAQTIGLTHRDIKPGNILHKEGTEIKIADFGAAINKVADHTVITNVGSPAYMSPELVAGTVQASHLTDIYALGVVMYYLLTGKLPFSGANTMSVIYQIVNTDPTPPSAVREGLLPEFDAIVMKAISKDPANRFQTWDEFGAALAQLWKEEAKVEEKRDETGIGALPGAAQPAVLRRLPRERFVGSDQAQQVGEVQAGDFPHQGGRPRRLVFHPRRRLRARDPRQEDAYRAHGGRLLRRDVLPQEDGRRPPLRDRDHHLRHDRHEDPRRRPQAGVAIGEAPVRRALPRHPRRTPRSRQPAARRDVLIVPGTISC